MVLKALFNPSVVPSFLHFSNAAALPLQFLNMSISYIFMKCTIFQRDPHNDTQAQTDLSSRSILVHKVDLDVLNSRAPAVEAKYLIRKIDDLLGS